MTGGIVTLPGGPYLANGRPNTKRSDPKDPAHLASPARERVQAMIRDCPYKGELGLVSGLRDPGRQWDLRRERVGLANVWNNAHKGSPVTAVPARWNDKTGQWEGGSQHQHGRAADFGGTARAMEWMRANRERYGLALTVSSENWHVEPDRRDVRTGRVHDNPSALAATAPPAPKPAPPKPTLPQELTVSEAAALRAEIAAANRRSDDLAARLRLLADYTVQQQEMDRRKINLVVAWSVETFGLKADAAKVAELSARLDALRIDPPAAG